ncbi:MAG TPA: FAD-linked oxidase C-terminal domain-containing protein [Saprospiraceae bacterium]|nr:FAD-linked oxidase C-terminal domain-containing protein [Saprospiraceae bacterium]
MGQQSKNGNQQPVIGNSQSPIPNPRSQKNRGKSNAFRPISVAVLAEMRAAVSERYLHTDETTRRDCGHDETEDLLFLPEAVAEPGSAAEISALMKICYRERIPVTVRGGGSGLAGGALPIHGGLVISMKRFDKILHLDERNFQVTVEPGIITESLQNTLKEKGLFYPPDPSSRGWSFIGGNVSTNAGGPRAVKYGVVKDHVLNLEVVLPNGEIIWTGSNTLKNSTGYNLTQLLVGSEGTLGVVTKIVLKLQPHPTQTLLMLAPFRSAESACSAVAAIFQAGVTPSALEFMERNAIDWAVRYVGETPVPIREEDAAHLLIEADGFHEESLYADFEKIARVLEDYDCGETFFANDDATKTALWKLRRNVAQAVKTNSIYKEEDTVVPRAELPFLLKKVKEVGAQFGFESVCYGHAGDGNLHVNILKGDLDDHAWNMEVPKGIREIFKFVKSKGGTISGEHGIGLVQRQYLDIVFSKTELRLMRQIKRVFDPRGILNPGKVIV